LCASVDAGLVADLGILQVQRGSLELDYLRSMAASLGVSDLLSRALEESEDASNGKS
jgi:hypothetical protein